MRAVLFGIAASAAALGCVQPTTGVVEPLYIINWSPAAALCVPTDATVYATFSSDLEESSLTADSFYLLDANGEVPADITYDAVTFTARLQAQSPLAFGSLYTAVAGTGVRSKSDGSLAVNVENSFVTTETTGCTPGVVCSVPADCPGRICSNVGVCIDACVTNRDCYGGTCSGGSCIDNGADSAPPGGDPVGGD